MEQLKERLKEFKVRKNELKKQMIEESKQVFNEGSKIIFDKHPSLQSFGWNQYTPYFNDGDTCEFSVNTHSPFINGEYSDELDELRKDNVVKRGDWDYNKREYVGRVTEPNPSYNQDLDEAVKEIREFLSLFDEEYFLDTFGDHMSVTVKRDGNIDTDYYEHD